MTCVMSEGRAGGQTAGGAVDGPERVWEEQTHRRCYCSSWGSSADHHQRDLHTQADLSIKPLVFLSEHATQLLVQALVLSRLDYCNARFIFNEPKRMHVTPLLICNWLPIAARIKYKALMFVCKTTSGSAPLYLNVFLQTNVPLEACVLNIALLFIPKRHTITFTDFYINCSLSLQSFTVFKNQLKTHLFHLYLTL